MFYSVQYKWFIVPPILTSVMQNERGPIAYCKTQMSAVQVSETSYSATAVQQPAESVMEPKLNACT